MYIFLGNYFTTDQLDGLALNNNNNINNNIIPTKDNASPNPNTNTNPNAIPSSNKVQKAEVTDAVDYPIRHSYGDHGELSTVVNIEVFDDQLSMSSISTNSRLSLEGPPSQSSPPLSLTNGLMDTNLMHFSESVTGTGVAQAQVHGRGANRFEVDDDDEEEEEEEEELDEEAEPDDDEREDRPLGRRNL